jgi:hypothetical protein
VPASLKHVDTLLASDLELVLHDRIFGTGRYRYLTFDVPAGVTRIDVALQVERPAMVGLGLFDPRGCGHGSPGFRGVTGAERREVFIGLREATPGFVPGAIPAGRWTVIVPVFLVAVPTRVAVRVRMQRGTPEEPLAAGPLPGVVRDAPGWYRGDLHCHTEASSDAWSMGSALTPAGWADQARALGMDFLAMTDHNVISQNHALARDAGDGVLLMAGEEVTSQLLGHSTVSGVEAGQWFDFRQSPFWLPLPAHGARFEALVAAVREAGGFLSAAHPMIPFMPWQFLGDCMVRPSARPDGFEVWNGRWHLHNELAVRTWHRMLCAGWDVVANGGSDLHGIGAEAGLGPGTPTTVVHASSLAVVAALRAGRSYITGRPDGVEVYLTASGPGGQETFTGGRIHAPTGTVIEVRVRLRRAGGLRLSLFNRAGLFSRTTVASDDETVEALLTMGPDDDFVRAEVRARPRPGLRAVLSPAMEALTNPIKLLNGPPPAQVRPEFAPVDEFVPADG